MTNTANFPRYAPATVVDIEAILTDLGFEPIDNTGMSYALGYVRFTWTDTGSRSFRVEQFTSEARWDVIGQVEVSGGLSAEVVESIICSFDDALCGD